MSDSLDHAAVIQDVMNSAGILASALRVAPQSHPDFDGKSCIKCGCEIPTSRLSMGRIRCVNCQTILEKRR